VEREAGGATISFDPNIRPALMGSRATARARVGRYVASSDVVKVSEEDLAWLMPSVAVQEVAEAWSRAGPALVLVTHGGRGSTGICAAGWVRVAALPVPVVDTVGAGDAFMAATLDHLAGAGMLGPSGRQRLRGIGLDELRRLLGHASRAAALTCARAGADLPARDELNQVSPDSAKRPTAI
jgi:fructokinase